MKCGSCRSAHDTVAEVRSCYGVDRPAAIAVIDPPAAGPTVTPASKPHTGGRITELPEGFYAVPSATGNNDLDFYRIKYGRKPGVIFVNRYIGGQGSVHISYGEQVSASARIAEYGPDKAGNLFADELAHCRDCGLPLTDDESRAARRGPICRGN